MDYRKIAAAVGLAAVAAVTRADDVKAVSYKPGDGFSFQTTDDAFKLTLGGRLQAQYAYSGVDAQPERVGVSQDASSFKIKRAFVWFKGNAFTRDLSYKIQADFSASFPLLDAWMNYRLADEFQLEAGQDIVPFSRQALNSSATYQFIERATPVDYYIPLYDMGAMVNGKIAKGLAYYSVGIFNGQGVNQARSTPNSAVNLRAVVNPLGDFSYAETDVDGTPNPLLSIGASYFMNKVAYGTAADALTGSNYQKGFLKPLAGLPGVDSSGATLAEDVAKVGMVEVDAAFKWMGLYAQGEYFLASAEAAKTVNPVGYGGPLGDAGGKRKLKSSGYYVQAGYMVLPRTLELAVRYGAYDPNTTSWETPTDTSAQHDQRTELSGGVNYYLYKHGFKLQATVSSLGREERSLAAGAAPTAYRKLNDLVGRVQAQVLF